MTSSLSAIQAPPKRTRMRRRNGSAYKSLLGSGSGTRNRPIAFGDNGPCCHESPMTHLLITTSQRSRMTLPSGCEQHTSTLPGIGLSHGSRCQGIDPLIRPVMQVWHTPVRQDHLTGTSHASASSSKLWYFGSHGVVIPLRANETDTPDPGGPGGKCGV